MPRLVALLFGLTAPVGRRAYAIAGVSLMLAKYALDAGLVYAVTHKVWTPLAYLNPVLTLRERDLGKAPEWLFVTLVALTLPFLWIGVTMSVRRAVDAGRSAWLGLGFFVPVLNYAVMILLAVLPSKPADDGGPRSLAPRANAPIDPSIPAALVGVAFGVAVAAVMGVLSIYALRLYGAALFFGTPVAMGAASTYAYNRRAPRPLGPSLLVGQASVVLAALGVLLFALEGLLCIAMAVPIASVLALFGSALAWMIARSAGPTTAYPAALLAMLPLGAIGEQALEHRPTYAVTTTIEIDAPPERVWPNVVGFSELAPPDDWFFRAGISYPMRARIDGAGVGATRRCEFSTGAFVEPITVWDEPRRLAFDVAEHPAPMHEWSPYRHVLPPHLDGYVRSKHGQFLLVPLPGGRTRVEGTTWYELRMAPASYWTVWTDALLHAVHGRVLRHVKALSEGALPPRGLRASERNAMDAEKFGGRRRRTPLGARSGVAHAMATMPSALFDPRSASFVLFLQQ